MPASHDVNWLQAQDPHAASPQYKLCEAIYQTVISGNPP